MSNKIQPNSHGHANKIDCVIFIPEHKSFVVSIYIYRTFSRFYITVSGSTRGYLVMPILDIVHHFPREGDTYMGSWSQSKKKPNGYGSMHYNPRKHQYWRSYSGGWKDGEFDGAGALEHVDGKYVGGFRKGMKHGNAIEQYSHTHHPKHGEKTTLTVKFRGTYKNGKRSNGELWTSDPFSMRYKGAFDGSGRYHGIAKVWINGKQEIRIYKQNIWVDKSGNPINKHDELQCLI